MNSVTKNKNQLETNPKIFQQDHSLFDLYNHLKQNILKSEDNCKDPIDQDSFYCLECQTSTCPKCSFSTHNNHKLIERQKYLYAPKSLFNIVNQELDEGFTLLKQKGEYEKAINETFNKLHGQLDKCHLAKLQELEELFKACQANLDQLKENIDTTTKRIESYYKKFEKFLSINVNNYDKENTFFLMNYEMIDHCEKKNNEALKVLNSQKDNLEEYKDNLLIDSEEIIRKYNVIMSNKERLTDTFDDYYWNIKLRASRYSDHIKKLQETLFEIVRVNGNFDYVNDLCLLLDSKNKKGIECLYNQHYFTSSCNENKKQKEKIKEKTFSDSIKIKIRSGSRTRVMSPMKKPGEQLRPSNSSSNIKSNSYHHTINAHPMLSYKNIDDITLDTHSKQRFFTYSIIDLYNKCFNNKHRLSYDSNSRVFDSYQARYVRLKERAKPIVGTNEISIYDASHNTIIKKKIQLEKEHHGYIAFPDGNRHIVINEWLYITGGVDSKRNSIKTILRVNLLTAAVEHRESMNKAHAYHSIDFLENYDCFIVIGGENNNKSCELFDLMTQKWTMLPDLNTGRANVSIYHDQYTSDVYAMFGMKGVITEGTNCLETVEVMELNDVNSGWIKVDYYKTAALDFKTPVIVLPFTKDKLLILGGKHARSQGKIYAFFVLNKNEMIQVDESIMEEIKIEEKKIQAYNIKINKEKKEN